MIRLRPSLLALLAVPALLAACATAEGYRQRTALWLGAPADALLLERGSPVARDRLSDGREVWTYFVRERHVSDGYTRNVPRERTVRRRDRDGEIVEITESWTESVYEPPREWWTDCETRFVIGLTGLVEDFRFVGDGCVAEEIY